MPAEAGVVGGLLLLGAIVGAFILPTLSDRVRKRKPYLLLGVLGSIPWLLGLVLAQEYWMLLVSAFAFGFLLVGIAPIGYQYAAELTYPVPEGTSNGMLTLAGQLSVVFIFAMEALRAPDGSFTPSFLILTGLMLVNALLITRLKESKLIAKPVEPGAASQLACSNLFFPQQPQPGVVEIALCAAGLGHHTQADEAAFEFLVQRAP